MCLALRVPTRLGSNLKRLLTWRDIVFDAKEIVLEQSPLGEKKRIGVFKCRG